MHFFFFVSSFFLSSLFFTNSFTFCSSWRKEEGGEGGEENGKGLSIRDGRRERGRTFLFNKKLKN